MCSLSTSYRYDEQDKGCINDFCKYFIKTYHLEVKIGGKCKNITSIYYDIDVIDS